MNYCAKFDYFRALMLSRLVKCYLENFVPLGPIHRNRMPKS